MKIQVRVSLLLLVICSIASSQDWQSASLNDTGKTLAVNGFGAYPQIGLVLAVQLLVLFGARYWNRALAIIVLCVAFLLTLLAVLPIAISAVQAKFELLTPQITSATGIADWVSQREVVHNLNLNSIAIWVTLLTLVAVCAWNLRLPFMRRALKAQTQNEWVN